MITRLKLKPGQKGTKKLVAEYGDALVCVRYRYDRVNRMRAKTAEIIVEKKAWAPPAYYQENEIVPVRIGFNENDLRNKARAAGGRWNPDAKLWFIPFGRIKGTELEKHIVLDARGIHVKQEKASNIRDRKSI